MANAHNKWRAIPDTPFLPETRSEKERAVALQTELKALGLYTMKIDGIWGQGSQKALDAFHAAANRIIELQES